MFHGSRKYGVIGFIVLWIMPFAITLINASAKNRIVKIDSNIANIYCFLPSGSDKGLSIINVMLLKVIKIRTVFSIVLYGFFLLFTWTTSKLEVSAL